MNPKYSYSGQGVFSNKVERKEIPSIAFGWPYAVSEASAGTSFLVKSRQGCCRIDFPEKPDNCKKKETLCFVLN